MWSTDWRRIDPINLSGKAGLPRRARRDGLVTSAVAFCFLFALVLGLLARPGVAWFSPSANAGTPRS